MNLIELHEKVIYPVVRIRTEKAGGSGSVIYSKPSAKKPGEFQTFVLTNNHVIADAIERKKEWDSVLKRDVKKEFMSPVTVEVFSYVNLSTVDSSNSYRANIVAYQEECDLAILKIDSPRQFPYVSSIIPRDRIDDLRMGMPVVGCGCSLLHDPFQMRGEITSLKEIIENSQYLMTSQNSIFGNSGGAVFLSETGEQVGVTARITGMNLGFSVDIMTWMGFCVAPQTIYNFLEKQELRFLYDPADTYETAMERREQKRKNKEDKNGDNDAEAKESK